MRRKPTLRSTRKAKNPKPPTDRELDALCREIVRIRDGFRCRRCGDREAQWSHVHSRTCKSARWMLENSLLLCARCHLRWWHEHPSETGPWLGTVMQEQHIARAARAARLKGFRSIDRHRIKQMLADTLEAINSERLFPGFLPGADIRNLAQRESDWSTVRARRETRRNRGKGVA